MVSGLRISPQTASSAVVTDSNQKIVSSSVTATELGYLSGTTSAVQTQLNNIVAGEYGIELEDYGGGTGVANNTPALNAAVTALASINFRVIKLRAGTYNFTTKPNSMNTGAGGAVLEGVAPSLTSLVRNYTESGGDDVGFLTWHGGGGNGGGLRNLGVNAATGTTGGSMIVFDVETDLAAGFVLLDDVIVSGPGTYERALLVDGMLNDVPGGNGYRDVAIRNCMFFALPPEVEAARFRNVQNLFITGSWANGNVIVTGSGGASTATSSLFGTIDMICTQGITIDNSSNISVRGRTATLTVANSTTKCAFHGVVDSTIIASGTNNVVSSYNSPSFPLIDGVVAPTAEVGRAFIYVDTSDGDLKVRFGDGTTKTLATDT